MVTDCSLRTQEVDEMASIDIRNAPIPTNIIMKVSVHLYLSVQLSVRHIHTHSLSLCFFLSSFLLW